MRSALNGPSCAVRLPDSGRLVTLPPSSAMVDHDRSIQESLVTTARPPADEPARSRVPVRHAGSSEVFTGTAQEERTHGSRES